MRYSKRRCISGFGEDVQTQMIYVSALSFEGMQYVVDYHEWLGDIICLDSVVVAPTFPVVDLSALTSLNTTSATNVYFPCSQSHVCCT